MTAIPPESLLSESHSPGAENLETHNPDTLELGYSFCPNDTFIFYALSHGKTGSPLPVRELLEDVQTLNDWATEARLPMTKISYRAYFSVMSDYVALRSGGALGRGVGPLIVARPGQEAASDLNGKTVASPGALTTAELLLRIVYPEVKVLRMRYDEVMPAVQRGHFEGQDIDAGLIIHESRFTYPAHGLVKLLDLGAWWEGETGLPLPLGAILVRRNLPAETQWALNQAVRTSLEYAWANPQEPKAYIRQHALEMSDEVMQAHIDLYVNSYSADVGDEGERAVQELYRRAVAAGAVEESELPLFVQPQDDDS
jgi:1,4-dihydroxy-6-naphthoate synthase